MFASSSCKGGVGERQRGYYAAALAGTASAGVCTSCYVTTSVLPSGTPPSQWAVVPTWYASEHHAARLEKYP